jgi:hypothetical protein
MSRRQEKQSPFAKYHKRHAVVAGFEVEGSLTWRVRELKDRCNGGRGGWVRVGEEVFEKSLKRGSLLNE